MEFDANLKREMLGKAGDNSAYLGGLLFAAARVENTDNSPVAAVSHGMYEIMLDYVRALRAKYPKAEAEMSFEEPKGIKKTRGYSVYTDANTTRQLARDYNLIITPEGLHYKDNFASLFKDEIAKLSFLQGVFLIKGRVTLPSAEPDGDKNVSYGVEMEFPSVKQAELVKKMISPLGIAFKDSERRDNPLLYIRDSEEISDFLARMGAPTAVLELQNIIVLRDVRNNINRVVNCKVANISKTADAAVKQIEAINAIEQKSGLNSLEPKLKELAELRLKYPEATLDDLAKFLGKDVTKSGINHRMRKLIQLSEE